MREVFDLETGFPEALIVNPVLKLSIPVRPFDESPTPHPPPALAHLLTSQNMLRNLRHTERFVDNNLWKYLYNLPRQRLNTPWGKRPENGFLALKWATGRSS